MRWGRALLPLVLGLVLAGCLSIQSPDLFMLTRTGQRDKLTLVVNDGGTIRCNDRAPRPLAEALLLRARDLSTALDPDAKQHLDIPQSAQSVSRFKIRLQDGTVSFPDTAAARHNELAQVELFTIDAAQNACGLSG